MEELGLTQEELKEIARACAPIRLGYSTPNYLQEFLALRLAGRPDTSSHIRRLSSDQLQELHRYLRERQSWLQD